MITEEARMTLLRILSLAEMDMDKLVAEMKKRGYDCTPEQIRGCITMLKMMK